MNQPVTEFEPAPVLGQYIPAHYHWNMLNDSYRLRAFRDAIRAVVQPGMHVLELGGGTGVLSWFAARCGARVTCVEQNPELIATARAILRDNPDSDRITLIETDATQYQPTERVDVLICEMLHTGLLREHQIEVLDAFQRHHHDRFGTLPVFLPDTTLQAVQPVEQDFEFLDYYAPVVMFQQPDTEQDRTVDLAAATLYSTVEYQQPLPHLFRGTVLMTMAHAGTLNALRFISKHLLAVLPDTQSSIDWHSQYLIVPLAQPLMVSEGDRIALSFNYLAGASITSLQQSIQLTRVPAHGDTRLLFAGEERFIPGLNIAQVKTA